MERVNSIISTVIRDDDRYLDEWVEYHLSIGFEHIVMYDHRSLIPVAPRWGNKVTVIYKEREDVTFPDNFHNETLKNFNSNWVAVLDVDEFIVLYQHKDINSLLANYTDYGGLSINWAVYGSSGHRTRPEGLVKDNYLWRMADDDPSGAQRLVNTIINSKYFIYSHNPHTHRSSRDIVTEDYEVCNSCTADSSRTLCRINHYITRSWEDWLHKIDRAKRAGVSHLYSEKGFYLVDDFCSVYDDILLDYSKPKIYDNIDGWFNFQNLYIDVLGKYQNGIFVEVGAWEGKSAVFMADKIKRSGKNIKFYVIDIWEPFWQSGKVEQGVSYESFLKNIEPVKEYITPIKGNSLEICNQFEDGSIDFIFLDSNHDYEHVKKEIALWLPKLKTGGIFAGHDYEWGGVRQAVDESFRVKVIPNVGAWVKLQS